MRRPQMRPLALALLLAAAGADLEGDKWVPAGVTNDMVDAEERETVTRPYPERLSQVSRDTLNSANDWHFAMMNDFPRNEAFAAALRKEVSASSTVIDVGAGSGLLSLLAARAGAGKVYAIEANADLVHIGQRIIKANELEDKIEVIPKMSTAVTTEHIGGGADVIVSEVLGTLLLGESALEYMADARDRLLRQGGAIIPAYATQYATVITSEQLDSLTRARGDQGLDLGVFNELMDTSSIFFSKQLGVRIGDLDWAAVSPQLELFSIDFYKDSQASLQRHGTYRFTALRDATIHAILFTWDAWTDKERKHVVSTHPNATRDNMPRDMAWGQALQLVEDRQGLLDQQEAGPVPLRVKKGDQLQLVMRHINTFSGFYGEVHRADPDGEVAGFVDNRAAEEAEEL
eukprot:TRINITY_DN18161_c0_g1_i1.p1 TRINITY_DN18161_c0_g1~~TRINITY_DN18161_c0_g1_i1.p1  ORF type:complete len:403 (+),score=133.46 TRINITY_DN18161_c0_g1_i1:77-1285(+)